MLKCLCLALHAKELWESGLIYLFAKEAGGKTPRGFESLRLRKKKQVYRHLPKAIPYPSHLKFQESFLSPRV